MYNGLYFYTALALFFLAGVLWIIGEVLNFNWTIVGVLLMIGCWVCTLFIEQAYPNDEWMGLV